MAGHGRCQSLDQPVQRLDHGGGVGHRRGGRSVGHLGEVGPAERYALLVRRGQGVQHRGLAHAVQTGDQHHRRIVRVLLRHRVRAALVGQADQAGHQPVQ